MTDDRYAPHEAMVFAARAKPELWRLLVGVAIVSVASFTLSAVVVGLLTSVFGRDWMAALPLGATPSHMIVLMGGFAFVTAGVALAVRAMHDRSLLSVLGPLPVAVRQFRAVLRMLLVVAVVIAVLPPYDLGEPLQDNLPLGRWLALLPVSMVVVLIQTSAEEILFRGYLQQALAARFSSPVVWLLVPSVLFAMGHYVPAEAGANAPIIALWAGVFGLMMADLTARSGTLGPAIAVHFFNNIVALVFIAPPEGLNGLSLYVLPYAMDDTDLMREWLAVDFAMMLVTWLAARIALRR